MVTIKNILMPVDFSESSGEALDYAVQLAEVNNANIHLLSIVEPLVIYDTIPTDYSEIIDGIKQDREVKMNELIADIKKKAPKITVFSEVVTQFEPSDAILNAATKNAIDLIVMGSHGRRGLNRVLMGSVTETVMRQADCPVLVLRVKEKNNK